MEARPSQETIADFVHWAWAEHARDPNAVAQALPRAIANVREPSHVTHLGGLVAHVCGEHLGHWAEGIRLLHVLEHAPPCAADAESTAAIHRGLAALHRCAGDLPAAESYAQRAAADAKDAGAGTRVRILATAATALVGQGRVREGSAAFAEALALAAYGPGRDDPAARALAVTGNNLACALEEKAERSPEERALMKQAAEVARRFWGIAGTWVEVERAEYRLAMVHLAVGEPSTALAHAKACLGICEANQADATERCFALEALAAAELAAGTVDAARAARDRAAGLIPAIDAAMRPHAHEALARLDRRLSARR
jgi:tetratricopeptide (TPR) repeat protein